MRDLADGLFIEVEMPHHGARKPQEASVNSRMIGSPRGSFRIWIRPPKAIAPKM